jgi:hypothetical protein
MAVCYPCAMSSRIALVLAALVMALSFACRTAGGPPPAAVVAGDSERTVVFHGMCDASGAVPLSDRLFAVADDEDNVLRVFDAEQGGPPIRAVDVSAALELPAKKKAPETDLEGATRIGDLALWITSHGRNSKGKLKPERLRLFATTASPDRPIELVGHPCTTLLDQLVRAPALAGLGLAAAAEIGPKEPGGLNIEGLTATADGGVFIGFRNPVPGGLAIVVPLSNPREVIDGKAAHFGAPARLDLGGLGVRALSSWRNRYLVAAGPIADGARPRLYAWSGAAGAAPALIAEFDDLNPEGFFTPDERDQIMVLSDDGTQAIDGQECKALADPGRKRFRGRWMDLRRRLEQTGADPAIAAGRAPAP